MKNSHLNLDDLMQNGKLCGTILLTGVGENNDGAFWTSSDDLQERDGWTRISPPDNWRQLIAEADHNSPGNYHTQPGAKKDWRWYQLSYYDARDQIINHIMIGSYIG